MSDAAHDRTLFRNPGVIVAFALGAAFVLQASRYLTGLRLEPPPVVGAWVHVLRAASFFTPMALLLVAWDVSGAARRAAYFVLLGASQIALLAMLLGSPGFFCGETPLRRVARGGGDIAVYRTDCGATTSYAVEIVEETRIVPWLYRVRPVHVQDRARDAEVRVAGDTVYCRFPGEEERGFAIP